MLRVKNTLKSFIDSEKSGGFVLFVCAIASLLLANSSLGEKYINIWDITIAGGSIVHWINDGLMAVFFLLVGLELIEEIKEGHLATVRSALLPVSGALGGMLIPALIYIAFNLGTDTVRGFGIPMATDIAFALGVLSLLGNRVPTSLKVFLTALAVIDDLGAIIIIATFYTSELSWMNLFISLGLFAGLMILNKVFKIKSIPIYILGGIVMWYFMLNSGIHATVAGVLLAIAVPYEKETRNSPCHRLQRALHFPVAFGILPLFALANTAFMLKGSWDESLGEPFALGIILGLVLGKPIGITLFAYLSTKLNLCKLPAKMKWSYIWGVSLLGGIGFTMSIFITLLAFGDNEYIQNESKLMILLASLVSSILGLFWLSTVLKPKN